MTLPDITAALRDLHVSIGQQQDLTKVVIQDAENARAEFRALTTGATNPLVNRALGNYAQGIVKLRDGSWLLAEAGDILAEYARAIGIDMPLRQPTEGKRKAELNPDEQSDTGPRQPGPQRVPQADEPAQRDLSAG
ncbi:hypothetical protein [Micromonospora chokoriensis]|uniref:Excreted virulence factor EspC, type VII ESX diderm n=1 Tax=Micromonospora chokoriensis TaxID=356851 RepID=A0A1C4WNB2_9ACTN|nr:hypothetical protein [Micromonospora chokoriensis]SCE97648.1 hypothetical protein GA0070612_2649 [Micromonospora chokoriensis]